MKDFIIGALIGGVIVANWDMITARIAVWLGSF
jgi:gas vesicle protein